MTIKRFIQYCVIGLSGVVVDMFLLFVMCDSRMLGLWVIPGKVIAAEVAIINNFIWNDKWTFRDCHPQKEKKTSVWYRLLRFNIICALGLALNVVLLTFFNRVLHLNLYLANLLAILAVTFWNFTVNYLFNWRVSKTPDTCDDQRIKLKS